MFDRLDLETGNHLRQRLIHVLHRDNFFFTQFGYFGCSTTDVQSSSRVSRDGAYFSVKKRIIENADDQKKKKKNESSEITSGRVPRNEFYSIALKSIGILQSRHHYFLQLFMSVRLEGQTCQAQTRSYSAH